MTYKDYACYLEEIFGPGKVQKISLNAGQSCPLPGRCIYCRNDAFTPAYCLSSDSLPVQLDKGIAFFARKYPSMRYLAYFQSYTTTNTDLSTFRSRMEGFLASCTDKPVVGVVVATRPDCLPDPMVEYLASLPLPVIVEIGAESSNDATLTLLGRGHTWQQTTDAVQRCTAAGLHVGLHLMACLPSETDDDLLTTVSRACALPIGSIKLHHLQVLRSTPLARMIAEGRLSVPHYTVEQYLALCARVVSVVPPHIAIERFTAQAPPDLVLHPRWNIRNYQFTTRLKGVLSSTGMSICQNVKMTEIRKS